MLTTGFSLTGAMGERQANEPPDAGQIDSWIVIHEDNTASILTGHQELGTGTATGLLMIAGEELDLDMSQLRFVSEDTSLTPNSFPSITSEGICGNGPEVRAAAAAAKQVLLGLASAELGVPVADLTISSGVVTGGGRSVTYGQLMGGKAFNTTIPQAYHLSRSLMPGFNGSAGLLTGAPGTKLPSQYRLIGTRVPRIDAYLAETDPVEFRRGQPPPHGGGAVRPRRGDEPGLGLLPDPPLHPSARGHARRDRPTRHYPRPGQ
jgi:nicotinate dehydrogenase subunit B